MYVKTGLLATAISVVLGLAVAADVEAGPPCTIHSPYSRSLYDLNPLARYTADNETAPKSARSNVSYVANGWDYGHNFTMNFCEPVVEDLLAAGGVEDLNRKQAQNVSAYYKSKSGTVYSIGQTNDQPMFRGKKLLLNYTGGSLCPELDDAGQPIDLAAHRKSTAARDLSPLAERSSDGSKSMDAAQQGASSSSKSRPADRRKHTLITFLCDKDPAYTSHPSIAFLGSPDHCTYVFEVRSRWACGGATPTTESGTLGPGSVFGLIFGIAVVVYLVGGIVYQRSVMHQRGWRQLPNYAVWSGIWSFFTDMLVICFSSCTRSVPSLGRLFGGKHAGYHRVGDNYRQNGGIGPGGRGRDPEDANRLIDSLDEEWD